MNKDDIAVVIGEKIKDFRKKNNWTQQELGDKIGMSKNAIGNYEKGFRSPKKDTMFNLAKVFNISIDDLFPTVEKRYEKKLPHTTDTVRAIHETVERLDNSRQLNVLTYSQNQLDEQERAEKDVSDIIQLYTYDYYDHPASAGTGQYLTDVSVERIELPVEIDADFVIPISGDSMEPDYHDGDYIFVKLSVDLASGDIGVFDYEGDAYVKQLIIKDSQAYLHSLNPDYADKPITPDTTFRIIGEVVGRYGKGEKNGL